MTEKTATELVAQNRQAAIEERTAWMKDLADFDWKKLPPHMMALVLTKKPYKGKKGEPDYYLSPEQALVFALRSFELDLSPLSTEVWFDRDRWTTNVTLEGQIVLARRRGVTSAPTFKDLKRPWKQGAVKYCGYTEEPGIEATVVAGTSPCSYVVWLSEWIVSTSPVWQAKPEHMMRVRAYEKALEFSGGVGISGMPDERNIIGSADDVPQISAQSVAPSKPERMPYASAGWKKDADIAAYQAYHSERGLPVESADVIEKQLTESIKQAQEKKIAREGLKK